MHPCSTSLVRRQMLGAGGAMSPANPMGKGPADVQQACNSLPLCLRTANMLLQPSSSPAGVGTAGLCPCSVHAGA